MELTEEQQEELDMLIAAGEKLEAIRYAQQTVGMSAEDAITLVEELEKKHEATEDAEFDQAMKEHSQSMVNVPRIVGSIFGGVGVVLLSVAGFIGYNTQKFLDTAVAVPGFVKEYRESEAYNSEEKRTYKVQSPVVDYHYNGTDYSWVSPYGSSVPEYQVGDQINLLLDPKDPGKPELNSFFEQWFVTILLLSLGLLFTGVGLIVYRAFRKA